MRTAVDVVVVARRKILEEDEVLQFSDAKYHF